MKKTPDIFIPDYTVENCVSTLSEVYDYGLSLSNVRPAWRLSRGEDTVCAVIDSGYQPHVDLEGAIIEEKCASFVGGKESTPIDLGSYHGLHCMGIIGARADNGIGLAGIAPECKLISLKVFGKSGTGNFDSINAALEHCIKIKPDVISMSLGSESPDHKMERLLQTLRDMNIPCVVAAGNNSREVNYPARYNSCIAVAALDSDGNPTNFTSRGDSVAFGMAGKDVYSCWKDNSYALLSGSSMACPGISGLLLLLISKHKKQEKLTGKNDCRTCDEMIQHLIKYSAKDGAVVKDPNFGYGIVNIGKMLEDEDSSESVVDTEFEKSSSLT